MHGVSGGGSEQASSTLAACLDALHTAPPPQHVVVIATTNQIEAVDSSLRRPGRFDREVEVTTPSAAERREVYTIIILKIDLQVEKHFAVFLSRCWRYC